MTEIPDWWKDAVIYGIDVKRFCDGNGDGMGDFPGLTSKLDYIADLGVTCIWLLPFYPCGGRDNGYDITDYFQVDPQLGTLDDFIGFVHAAGERGIRVIVDFVTNHTSDKHPWFQAARNNAQSRYRRYYYWADNPPPMPEDRGPAFPGEETSIWSRDERAGAFYYHRFYRYQPTLDPNNVDVREEFERILDFWISFGISGFRIDAAALMVEAPSPEYQTMDDPHDILRELHARAKKHKKDSILLGEVDETPDRTKPFLDGRQMDMVFNFWLNNHIFLALADESAAPLRKALGELPALPRHGQWACFLRNFDEANIRQLEPEEQTRVYGKFAPNENMRIYDRGMRRRIAPMLGGNQKYLKMVYSLLFSLPGAPCIMYGDEIGMGEDLAQPGRYSVRSPMQWNDKKNGGFSSAAKSRLIQPVIETGPFAYKKINAQEQQARAGSLFAHIKKLAHLRRERPMLCQDTVSIIPNLPDSVLGMIYRNANHIVIMVHNLKNAGARCDITLEGCGRGGFKNLFDGTAVELEETHLRIALDAYGFCWLESEGG